MLVCPECGIIDDSDIDEYGDCIKCGNPTYEEEEDDDQGILSRS